MSARMLFRMHRVDRHPTTASYSTHHHNISISNAPPPAVHPLYNPSLQKGAYVCDSPAEEMHNTVNALFAAERAD